MLVSVIPLSFPLLLKSKIVGLQQDWVQRVPRVHYRYIIAAHTLMDNLYIEIWANNQFNGGMKAMASVGNLHSE